MSDKELKTAGLKVTGPRLKILRVLETEKSRHLSADDIYQCLMTEGTEVSMATIYRVLTQFEQAGLVNRHHFEGGQSVFELDDGQHHDHIVCVKCGVVQEFYDVALETRKAQIAQEHGFKMTDHDLHLYGICPVCQKKETQKKETQKKET